MWAISIKYLLESFFALFNIFHLSGELLFSLLLFLALIYLIFIVLVSELLDLVCECVLWWLCQLLLQSWWKMLSYWLLQIYAHSFSIRSKFLWWIRVISLVHTSAYIWTWKSIISSIAIHCSRWFNSWADFITIREPTLRLGSLISRYFLLWLSIWICSLNLPWWRL
jgi:hypothetical protein